MDELSDPRYLHRAARWPAHCPYSSLRVSTSIVMWLCHLRSRYALPIGAGLTLRLYLVGPRSTVAVATLSRSTSIDTFNWSAFCSAFAIADRNVFSIGRADLFLEPARIPNASFTFRPRIKSITSRAFWGDPFMYFATARAFIVTCLPALS